MKRIVVLLILASLSGCSRFTMEQAQEMSKKCVDVGGIPHVEYAIIGDGVHSMHCDMELVPR